MTQAAPLRLPLYGADTTATAHNALERELSLYLRQQRELTAVERFAQRHEADELPAERLYHDLIPLRDPVAGEQLAFRVDLDACTGCKACVSACHHLNGLDTEEAEVWRKVGLLHGGTPEAPVQQSVTAACHHCLDPACMKGCPVGAYEKDALTGIVRHLDDQCIGCRYCTFMCPYDVPQYSPKRGIVRKCDMCSDRLVAGEAPACVDACPNAAISIQIVKQKQLIDDAQADLFVPTAASPGITLPTTSYVSKRALPRNALPADFYRVRAEHQHMPLVLMLVLTQLSVGAFCAEFMLRALADAAFRQSHAIVALTAGLLALGASVLHLGRPAYAFRAVLGFRTSWLSREAVAFGLFAALGVAYAASVWQAALLGAVGIAPIAPELARLSSSVLGVSVALSGLFGVACSTMVYAATARSFWSTGRTAFRFGTSAALLGSATTLVTLCAYWRFGAQSWTGAVALPLAYAIVAGSVIKLLWELGIFSHLRSRRLTDLKRSALLLKGDLKNALSLRVLIGALGGVLMPLLLVATLDAPAPDTTSLLVVATLAWLLLLGGEIVERILFFQAVSAPKMPGAQ